MRDCTNIKYYFPYQSTKNESFVDKIIRIYGKLADEKSKIIFSCRLMYSLTNDYRYIEKLICSTDCGRAFKKLLYERSKNPIYIYGAGVRGVRLKRIFSEINFTGFIDKNQQKKICDDIPVYEVNYVARQNEDYTIIISIEKSCLEIKDDLIKRGIRESSIIMLKEMDMEMGQHIYFDSEIVKPNANKMFLDIGCYDGKDTDRYLTWCKNADAVVAAFEADLDNYLICKSHLSRYKNVRLYNIGISDEQTILFFDKKGEVNSSISEQGNCKIQVHSLDCLLNEQNIGYIKMDIEGSEEKALMGARNIISTCKPNLAVSIYHKREDIWNLPNMILDLNSTYKLFLRHYTVGLTDTVLYAIAE